MNSGLNLLLKKYNVPGPRYTSYPTVPAWSETVGTEEYRKGLSSLGAEEPLSLYFHLPFCERLCHFCGCMQVITKDHSRSRPYVGQLIQEMKQVRNLLPSQGSPVTQVHFGGGTPNFLQPEELTDLVSAIRKSFQWKADAELAIEMHPRTSTPAFCDTLKELEFNRISLGIQDFDPRVQQLIHRDQTYQQTREMVEYLRQLGFKHFNFDLIYGLPGQNLAGWRDTLKKVIDLHPNRLAIYSYAHVPWVRPVQRSFKDSDLPDPELKLKLFEMAYKTLVDHEYRPIGMDHFALADDELTRALDKGTLHRNFMGYSTRADAHQIGFGVSAISYVGGNYFQNAKKLQDYETAIDGDRLATFRGFLLSKDDALRRDLITQIMCRERVDIPILESRWGINFEEYFRSDIIHLKGLMADQLVHINKKELAAQGLGHLFLRNIAMAFDPYLEEIRRRADNPTFSKTV